MKANKRRKLEAAGWRVGDAREFLELTSSEAEFVEIPCSEAAPDQGEASLDAGRACEEGGLKPVPHRKNGSLVSDRER